MYLFYLCYNNWKQKTKWLWYNRYQPDRNDFLKKNFVCNFRIAYFQGGGFEISSYKLFLEILLCLWSNRHKISKNHWEFVVFMCMCTKNELPIIKITHSIHLLFIYGSSYKSPHFEWLFLYLQCDSDKIYFIRLSMSRKLRCLKGLIKKMARGIWIWILI